MASENPFDLIHRKFESLEKSIGEIRELINSSPERDHVAEHGGVSLAMEVTLLSRHSIYRLASQRKIPCSKRGGRLYFSRKALMSWIDQGQRKEVL